MNEEEYIKLGSDTAKEGFRNEDDVVMKFNMWDSDEEAQKWLKLMGYPLAEVDRVESLKVSGQKADVQVQITRKNEDKLHIENLQVKLVSNQSGFNQIDKRWLDRYHELWNFPEHVFQNLKHFTGELPPKIANSRDSRRMFLDEFSEMEQKEILEFFTRNQNSILSDILRGRGEFSAEWMLVCQKLENDARWILKPMDQVVQHYAKGGVRISPRGSLYLGRITVQRKGGDGGRITANMLQFKINPTELFELK